MKYNRFGYFIGEGFGNVFKNKKSTIASLVIMCATMIIFGIFLALTENINHFVSQLEADQGIQVFIDDVATQEQIDALGEKIRSLNGVSTTEFVSKEEAVNQMKEWLEGNDYLLEGREEIFPASYIVKLTDLSLMKEVRDQISTFENIKEIRSADRTVETLLNLANGIKIVTGIILIFMIIISVFIISNTIKLTVHARRKEISIMKYVGATNGFIRWPFIVEGMIIGIISSTVSIFIVGITYNYIATLAVNSELFKLIGISLVTFKDMFNSIIFVYMLLGIGIGAIGSVISMRKYLKV